MSHLSDRKRPEHSGGKYAATQILRQALKLLLPYVVARRPSFLETTLNVNPAVDKLTSEMLSNEALPFPSLCTLSRFFPVPLCRPYP